MGLFNRKNNRKQNDGTAQEHLVVPAHIAIIPDGNRRWAKERRLPVAAGHKEGAEVFRRMVRHAESLGVKYITFYAFSTENWKRDDAEVETLMKLLLNFLVNSERELGKDKDKIRIKVIGDRSGLSEDLQREIARVEKETENNTAITANMAINYGGRDEIVRGARKIAKDVQDGRLNIDDIDEKTFVGYLDMADLPEVDLIIRPSGEKRLSNFMLWGAAYAEFWYSDICWPDFKDEDMRQAIYDFQNRDRRFGGVK